MDPRNTSSTPALNERGAQAERTLLAWQRSCFVLMLNGFLLVRAGLPGHELTLLASGLAAIAAAGLLYVSAGRRLSRVHGAATTAHSTLLGFTACVSLLLCLAGSWHYVMR